jgi:hypothetical protein
MGGGDGITRLRVLGEAPISPPFIGDRPKATRGREPPAPVITITIA